jgi:hypothetical protein
MKTLRTFVAIAMIAVLFFCAGCSDSRDDGWSKRRNFNSGGVDRSTQKKEAVDLKKFGAQSKSDAMSESKDPAATDPGEISQDGERDFKDISRRLDGANKKR